MKQIRYEDFWSNNPCGIDGDFEKIARHRYRMEPYLPIHLKCITTTLSKDSKILEIGSGQGTDALFMSSLLSKDNKYVGIDYSSKSIEISNKNRDVCIRNGFLKCIPEFQVGDALNINSKDEYFDFIYSMGVLHHTPNMQLAIKELHRVLKKGKQATIYLYRTGNLKVEVAKFLRKIQKVIDFFLRKDRSIYLLLNNKKNNFLGTMLLECFGVPILDSISAKEIEKYFSDFSSVKYHSCGKNFPFNNKRNTGEFNRFGVFYKIDLIK